MNWSPGVETTTAMWAAAVSERKKEGMGQAVSGSVGRAASEKDRGKPRVGLVGWFHCWAKKPGAGLFPFLYYFSICVLIFWIHFQQIQRPFEFKSFLDFCRV